MNASGYRLDENGVEVACSFTGISVDYQVGIEGGTATEGDDYAGGSGSLSLSSDDNSATITVVIIDDSIDEWDETFTVELSGAGENVEITSATATGTIIDDDLPPNISVQVLDNLEGNPDDEATFITVTVKLLSPVTGAVMESGKPISMDYATNEQICDVSLGNHPARDGFDYFGQTGTLSFASGETEKSIDIEVNRDLIYEYDETFGFLLSNTQNATLTTASAIATIQNDEDKPKVSINDIVVRESDGIVTFTISADRLTERNDGAQVTTSNDSAIKPDDYLDNGGRTWDFVPCQGGGLFPEGATEQTFSVAIVDDQIDETSERFNAVLSLLPDAELILLDATAWATIVGVNVSVDANNDGQIDDVDDPPELDHPGKIVGIGDPNRTEVRLSVVPTPGQLDDATVTLAYSANLVVYLSADGDDILDDLQWRHGDGDWPDVVYVEGVAVGTASVTLTLTADAASGLCGPDVSECSVSDAVGMQVAGIEGLNVAVLDGDDGWVTLDEFEGHWWDDDVRWQIVEMQNSITNVASYVEAISWYKKPASAIDDEAWGSEFTSVGTVASAYGNLLPGHWIVRPVVHFFGGAVATFVANYQTSQEKDESEVASIEWRSRDFGGNGTNYYPGDIWGGVYKGGDEVRPEYKDPNALGRSGAHPHDLWTKNFDTIDVVVTLEESLPAHFKVSRRLKLVDPDHYANAGDFDTNDETDGMGVNINKAGDNIGDARFVSFYADDPGNGQIPGWNVLADVETLIFAAGTTEGKKTLQILDPVPTDNYRVYTATRKLTRVPTATRFKADGRTVEVLYDSQWITVPRVTEVLSVVRTLHAELDRMEDPATPDRQMGQSPSEIPFGNIVGVEPDRRTITIDKPIAVLNAGQFIGGTISVYAADDTTFLGTLDVVLSGVGAQPQLVLGADLPTGAVKFKHLFDDDVEAGSVLKVDGNDMEVDTSLWESRLQPAFIRVDFREDIDFPDEGTSIAPNVNDNDLEFKLHVADFEQDPTIPEDQQAVGTSADNLRDEMIELVDRYRSSVNSREFWVVYFVGVHQIVVEDDGDHFVASGDEDAIGADGTSQRYVSGKNARGWGFKTSIALIAAETIREYYELRARANDLLEDDTGPVSEQTFKALIALHELGHAAGLDHSVLPSNGRIMEPESVGAMIDRTVLELYSIWDAPFELSLPTMEEMVFSEMALRQIVQNRAFVQEFEGF